MQMIYFRIAIMIIYLFAHIIHPHTIELLIRTFGTQTQPTNVLQ